MVPVILLPCRAKKEDGRKNEGRGKRSGLSFYSSGSSMSRLAASLYRPYGRSVCLHPNRSRIMRTACASCAGLRAPYWTPVPLPHPSGRQRTLPELVDKGSDCHGLPSSFTHGIHGPELETCVKGVRGCVHVVNGGLTESLEDIAGFPLLNAELKAPPRRDDTPCGRCCAFCRNA